MERRGLRSPSVPNLLCKRLGRTESLTEQAGQAPVRLCPQGLSRESLHLWGPSLLGALWGSLLQGQAAHHHCRGSFMPARPRGGFSPLKGGDLSARSTAGHPGGPSLPPASPLLCILHVLRWGLTSSLPAAAPSVCRWPVFIPPTPAVMYTCTSTWSCDASPLPAPPYVRPVLSSNPQGLWEPHADGGQATAPSVSPPAPPDKSHLSHGSPG